MPPMRRQAKPDTVEIIAEDLRLARESGGLERSDPKCVLGTVVMFGTDDNDDLDAAVRASRAVLATHLRRTCEAVIADTGSDACDRAAAQSLHASLLRPRDETQKVATIRRAALASSGCALGLDGLRKPEDALILRAAAAAHADLVQRRRERGPQTVEEAVRHSGPLLATVHEEFHEGLPLLYQLAPSQDERMKRGFMWNALLGAAVAIGHLRQIVEIHVRTGSRSAVDFLFADIARHAMMVAFAEADDKQTLDEVLTSIDHWEISEFIPAIQSHPKGTELLDRWGVWLGSCHSTCAYQRSEVIRLCCHPHQFTIALEEFNENYNELISGELEAFLTPELAAWGISQ